MPPVYNSFKYVFWNKMSLTFSTLQVSVKCDFWILLPNVNKEDLGYSEGQPDPNL